MNFREPPRGVDDLFRVEGPHGSPEESRSVGGWRGRGKRPVHVDRKVCTVSRTKDRKLRKPEVSGHVADKRDGRLKQTT